MNDQPLKILFKYPSRGRRQRFLDGMHSIINNLKDANNYQILVTADSNDPEMDFVNQDSPNFKNTIIKYGESVSKIHAINKDMEFADNDWDIIVCMSDDMRFLFYGFDEIIRSEFKQHGLDTLLHIPDQDAGAALQTMYIAGRAYYDRFGFIYNPVYDSLFCDNEVHEIAVKLGKYRYVDYNGLLAHLNPAYGHLPKDELFISQQQTGWTKDSQTYNERKAKNFYMGT
jgi:hypothetical protein